MLEILKLRNCQRDIHTVKFTIKKVLYLFPLWSRTVVTKVSTQITLNFTKQTVIRTKNPQLYIYTKSLCSLFFSLAHRNRLASRLNDPYDCANLMEFGRLFHKTVPE